MASNPSPYGGGGGTSGVIPPAGDLGGNVANPTVISEHFTAPLPVVNGGTGQATAQLAINALAGAVTNHLALAGDGTNITARALVAADLPALNALTVPAAAVAFNSQKITGLANGSAATDGAAFGQIPALSATAGNFLTEGVASAGVLTTSAAADHVHPANAHQALLLAPSGALAETYERQAFAPTASGALTSGTVWLAAIPLAANIVVANISFALAGTSGTLTHGWFVLTDANRVVRAASSDVVSGTWASGIKTLAMQASYTIPTNGLYYIGLMAVATNLLVYTVGNNVNLTQFTPVLAGSSSTSQTTPPSNGTTLGALSATSTWYGYVS